MTTDRTDVLIAGAGLAGSRTAECLRALGFDGRVVVAGDESHPTYERPALSKEFLAGRRPRAGLALRDAQYWRQHEIELWPGAPVESIDVRSRRAVVGGRTVAWRRLVIATGSAGAACPRSTHTRTPTSCGRWTMPCASNRRSVQADGSPSWERASSASRWPRPRGSWGSRWS